MPELYRTENHPKGFSELPQYEVRCGEIYRTETNEKGYIQPAQYVIREGKIYRTENHVDGYNPLPQYKIKGCKIYRATTHKDGPSELPDLLRGEKPQPQGIGYNRYRTQCHGAAGNHGIQCRSSEYIE